MTNLEKAIKGLECCMNDGREYYEPSNGKCPYYKDDITASACVDDLFHDIYALLKTQESRVMTLEEIKSCSHESVWFEEKPNHTIKQLTQAEIAALILIGYLHDWNGFGTVWRCWTAKPTEEQRKAVKWE